MGRTVRIGMIGCGFYAQNHLESWRHLAPQGAQLTAVCDTDPASAKAAGQSFGVPHFTDAAAMLDQIPLDVVDIATRQDTHRALAEAAIAHRVAVIVQKPFAPTWADCVAIVDAADHTGSWLAVHENFRFQSPMRHVRRIVTSGEIGQPTWARIVFRTGYDVFATQPYFRTDPRLAIEDVGVHLLDLARVFIGEVARVTCEIARRTPGIRGEDTATLLLAHTSGATSQIDISYAARPYPDPFPETLVEIEGTLGALSVHPGCQMSVRTAQGSRTEQTNAPLLPWTSHPWHVSQEGAYAACAHFLDCLQRGVPAETAGADNLRTYALVDAAYLAAERHHAIAPQARTVS